jgi:D-alanine-D-alanine ligase
MRIALLANLKENAPSWEGIPLDQWDDLDSPKTIHAILDALESGGHQAEFFEANIGEPFNLVQNLNTYQPDLCFNIAEGHFGIGREAQIPAVLEMLRLPYTGSDVLTLALALDKPMTKRILHYHDLPTPEFQTFGLVNNPIDQELLNEDGELAFPMFAKPSREGTGMGVSASSIISTVAELRERVEAMLVRYSQPVLCERFIPGREVTLGIIGNMRPTAARRLSDRAAVGIVPKGLTFFPPLEVDTSSYGESEAGLYTGRIKVELADDFHYICPANIEPKMEKELVLLAAAVFRVTGCRDVARVDFRLDETQRDKPYILEVNPLPGLNPGYSDLCVEAAASGWSYEQLINTIVDLAAKRQGIKSKPRRP